jgi:hypothetical protein
MTPIRTFHYDLHVVHQTMDNVKGLDNSYLGLLEGESIQSLEHRFNVVFTQKLSGEFLCSNSSHGLINEREVLEDLLNFPWLICFVARASTANISTNILIIVSVIPGVGLISV